MDVEVIKSFSEAGAVGLLAFVVYLRLRDLSMALERFATTALEKHSEAMGDIHDRHSEAIKEIQELNASIREMRRDGAHIAHLKIEKPHSVEIVRPPGNGATGD